MADLNPPKLIIDDYEQLITDSLLHMQVVSDGAFTDTSPAGPMRPFAGTMAFVGSELLYLANKSAESAAKSFLADVVGVPEDLGSRSTVLLQFGLSASLTTNFTIPKDFQVSDSSGQFRFYTDETITIPPGLVIGEVSATAEEIGSRYNLGAGQIKRFGQALTYLSYVTNPEPSSGGREPETPEDLIERAAIAIRLRNPVSEQDFVDVAILQMGSGSRAKAIGLLGRDKILDKPQPGVVHVFLLDKLGNPPPPTQMNVIGQTISSRLMLGTRLVLSAIEFKEIYVDIICKATGEKSLQNISDDIFEALQNFFSYKTYPIGESVLVEEVKYVCRNTGGIQLNYLALNDENLNIPMPNPWTIVKFTRMSVEIIDTNNATFTDTQFIPLPGVE